MQKEGPSDQRTARLHASALVRPRGVVLPRKHLVPRLQHLHGRRTRREASDRTPDFFWLSDLRAIWGPRSFFFAPALVRSRYPGRSCCRSTLSHLGEDRTEQSPTQPRTTQNGPSARTVWQTPLRTSATLQSPTQATCMQSGPKSTHAQTQPLISSACANGALLCISASTWHDPSVRQNSLSRQFSLKTLRFKPPLLHTFGSAAYNRFPNFFHNLNFAR